jgi:hypothetical protein
MAGERKIWVSYGEWDTGLASSTDGIIRVNVADDDNQLTWQHRVHRDAVQAETERLLPLVGTAFDELSRES